MSNPALIVDAGVATVAAGPTNTAVVVGAGSTFTVRNAALGSGVYLNDAWRESAHAGRFNITSPNLVPVSNGIRVQTPSGLADFNLPYDWSQPLIPQDNLTIMDDGTAADVDMVAISTYYENLPGGGMTLKMPGDISGQIDFILGWPVAITSSATAGAQNTTVITTTVDSSTANTWYAVLGYLTDTQLGCVGISGVDTSQLFCGGPGDTSGQRTRRYFADMSLMTGRPCIPLFNAANKANTNIVAVDHAASVAANVTLILAQMVGNYTP